MTDHKEIFLQPECCADPDTGRLWCQDDSPVDCDEGKNWTRYIRADLFDKQHTRIAELEGQIQEMVIKAAAKYRPAYEKQQAKISELQSVIDRLADIVKNPKLPATVQHQRNLDYAKQHASTGK